MKKLYCFIAKTMMALAVLAISSPVFAAEEGALPEMVEMENVNAIFAQQNWKEYDDAVKAHPTVVLKSQPIVTAKVVDTLVTKEGKEIINYYFLQDSKTTENNIIVLRTPSFIKDNESTKAVNLKVGTVMPASLRGEVEFNVDENDATKTLGAPVFVLKLEDENGTAISTEDFCNLTTEDATFRPDPALITTMDDLLANPAKFHGKKVTINATGTYNEESVSTGTIKYMDIDIKDSDVKKFYLHVGSGRNPAPAKDGFIRRVTISTGIFDWGSVLAGFGVVNTTNPRYTQYQEVKTITELKKVVRGYNDVAAQAAPQVIYTGEAMVTFFENINNGFIVQDNTGAMLVRNDNGNYAQRDSNPWAVSGKVLTNLAGKASDVQTEMSRIFSLTSTDAEATSLTIVNNEPAAIAFKEYDSLTEYMKALEDAAKADPTDSEGRNYTDLNGVAVKIKNVTVNRTKSAFDRKYTLVDGDKTMSFESVLIVPPVFPAGGEIAGYYGMQSRELRFINAGNEFLKPTAFFTIQDMKNFITPENADDFAFESFEITEPVVVNHVSDEGKGNTIMFVQQTNTQDVIGMQNNVYAMGVQIEGRQNEEAFPFVYGDSIIGLKGTFEEFHIERPSATDSIPHGSAMYMQMNDIAKVTKIGHTDEVTTESQEIEILRQNPERYEGLLIALSKGTVHKTADPNTYIYRSKQRVGKDSVDIDVISGNKAALAKLEATVGKECHIVGLYDMIRNNKYNILVRDENDIKPLEMHFKTIKEMKEAGQPETYTTLYVIDSPLLVTYFRHYRPTLGEEYALFLRDNTGTIGYRLTEKGLNNGVEEGDSVANIMGRFYEPHSLTNQEEGYYWVTDEVAAESRMKITKKNNEVIYTETTIADLNADKEKYAFDVIEIKDAEYFTDIQYVQGMPATRYWFIQVNGTDTAKLQISEDTKNIAEKCEEGKKYTLRGGMDFNRFGFGFSMFLFSATETVDVNNVETGNNAVYMSAEKQIVAEEATAIEVFDIQGRRVMSANADRVNASALGQGVYIVRSMYENGTSQITKVIR